MHISRCIESVKQISDSIVVVDSYSTDDTLKVCEASCVKTYQRTFVSQAEQFGWAMSNCHEEAEWLLRIDADETIGADLAAEILGFLEDCGNDFNGAVFHRKHIFMSKWIKHGGRYPLPLLRLFRRGKAHIEQKWMDEHIVLNSGRSKILAGDFRDDNLNPLSWFIDKHNRYATREMVDIMLSQIEEYDSLSIDSETNPHLSKRRELKNNIYLNLPYFIRPILYFSYRYFIQLGFLDGKEGFIYHFMQGLWYRLLVDAKCIEAKKSMLSCKSKKDKIRILEQISGLKLTS